VIRRVADDVVFLPRATYFCNHLVFRPHVVGPS
jgi:hypothetical protein